MKRLLIRADDLGYSEGINYGIAKSVKDGIISSVGVMTNMPSVEMGLNLLKDETVCYGLHTNICVGKPLTNPKKIHSLVQENGEFKTSKEYRSTNKDFVNLDEVILEIEAQYERFIKIVGRKPQYFEGHAVASENFFKGLEIVSKRHNCDYFPFSYTGESQFRNTKIYVSMNSMHSAYDPFEEMKKIYDKEYKENECPMMICHPGYLDAYVMEKSSLTFPRVQEVEFACAKHTKKWIEENQIQLVTFDDLK